MERYDQVRPPGVPKIWAEDLPTDRPKMVSRIRSRTNLRDIGDVFVWFARIQSRTMSYLLEAFKYGVDGGT